MTDEPKEKNGLAQLLEPFQPHEILKLPKPYKKDSPKGKCSECGGFHGLPAVHLDYVGHAALTKRLLMVDPHWNWEPVAWTPEGLPLLDKNGGLWIKLTVCGVTRLGYGHADGKAGGDAIKEAVGDAMRNSAMRFGAALDLWHKGDLYDAEEKRSMGWEVEEPDPKKDKKNPPANTSGNKDLTDILRASKFLEGYKARLEALTDMAGYDRLIKSNMPAREQIAEDTPEVFEDIKQAEKTAYNRIAEIAPFK